ncbi:hypothetical protein OOJ09_31175 [Mesorhizobium qingshengii]|uniref:Response regulatory domain-containing protein n=1 Tax=Mesorhizobium qingshengii TaxID=1165689 RepID=A0ABT4R481_9HYPH|nr:hypothetical protein [Mesorhizobium qingshengii]MCZ8548643.1 hypothetical protein [Mesorhizobium qingshengii]
MVQFLVEDQPPIAMRLAGLLADGGSRVFEARTMSDALTVVFGEYAIISLQLDVDLIDGWSDLAHLVSRLRPDIHIPVASGQSRLGGPSERRHRAPSLHPIISMGCNAPFDGRCGADRLRLLVAEMYLLHPFALPSVAPFNRMHLR